MRRGQVLAFYTLAIVRTVIMICTGPGPAEFSLMIRPYPNPDEIRMTARPETF
jgi:hypothetical protein